MARPRKTLQTVAEIQAEILEDEAQRALLQRDLQEALVAGENTRPYRQALAEIGTKISFLSQKLEDIQEAEAERRYALTAATAAEITAESVRRHIDLLAGLDVPPLPLFEGN